MNRERAWLAGIIAVVVLVTAAWFWPATGGALLTGWDDDIYLAELQKDHSVAWAFTVIQPFYYHPLTWLSYRLDQAMAGLEAHRFHATNVVLHAGNAALLVWLAWRLGGRIVPAALIGLAFGLHPLNVEPVAWMAERKTLLCGLFTFATVGAYIHGRRWTTVALFACALLAKPAAMTLPVALLAMDFFPLRRHRERSWPALVGEKWPLFALAGACLVATVVAQHHEAALISWQERGLFARGLEAMRGVVFYLWKFVWPAWLSPFYPMSDTATLRSVEFAVPAAIVLAVSGAAIVLRRRWPAVLTAWVSYLALVLPTSGLAQAGSQAVADRFAYLSLVPVLLAAGIGAAKIPRRVLPAVAVLIGVWLLFLAEKTRAQIPVWCNTETMWRAVLEHYPAGAANAQLAAELVRQGRFDEAEPYAELAFEKRPEHPAGRWALAQICLRRAEEKVRHGDLAGARALAERAVSVLPADATAHGALGAILLRLDEPAAAARELEEALRLDTQLPVARRNLERAYERMGRK